MSTSNGRSLISLERGTKRYGQLTALNDVSIDLGAGEILAVVGKNGSGKSTLIKILSGVITPDEGELRLNDEKVEFMSPYDALHQGVVTVHQELSVIPELTVAENIVLGNWPQKRGMLGGIDHKKIRATALKILDELDESKIDVDALVSSLSIAERQIIEIARALVQRPKILLLDEPFSTLSAHEVEVMSKRIRAIAKAGLAVAFVTHRLGEVKDIATDVVVLRDGNLIARSPSSEISVREVAQYMLGETQINTLEQSAKRAPNIDTTKPVLRVRDFSVAGKFSGLDLDLFAGEIVGIAGLLGSGRSEFLRALIGLEPCEYTEFELLGEKVQSPDLAKMIDGGVYFVPEERKLEGIFAQMSVLENLELPTFAGQRFVNPIKWQNVRTSARAVVDKLTIKVSDTSEQIANLSGGNQQKVVLGRWIKRGNTKLFLLDEPSRGVDIHARQQIQAVIEDLASEGVSVLVVASELEELFEMCHRLVLVRHGRAPRSVNADETNLEKVTEELLDV